MARIFFNPRDVIVFSYGGLTGVGRYGFYEGTSGNTDGGAPFLMNPNLFIAFKFTPYAQLTIGTGYNWVPQRLSASYFDNDLSSFNLCIQLRNGGLH